MPGFARPITREKLASSPFCRRGAERLVVHERCVDVRIVQQPRARRQDADDFDRRAGDRDGAAEHVPVAAELAQPEPVIEHGHAFASRLILAGQQVRPSATGKPSRPNRPSLTFVPRISRGSPAPSIVYTPPENASTCSNVRVSSRTLMKSGGDSEIGRAIGIERGDLVQALSASRNGSGASSTPWTTLKMALLAPMPRARVVKATAVKAGRAAQHAQRVSDILAQFGHVFGSCHVTLPSFADRDTLVARAVVVAETAQGQRSRALRRHALLDELARPASRREMTARHPRRPSVPARTAA